MDGIETMLHGVTVGPDGTIIGFTNDVPPVYMVVSLDLFWIDAVWNSKHTGGAVAQMAMLADGAGDPGAVPANLDYRPAVRDSSCMARLAMLRIARVYVQDPVVARRLGIRVRALREVLHEAYGLPRRVRNR